MSLPLKDLGSIKVSEEAHSYLKARSDASATDVVASLAREIHSSKGFGEIYGGGK